MVPCRSASVSSLSAPAALATTLLCFSPWTPTAGARLAKNFLAAWGTNGPPKHHPSRRQITMVKRSEGSFGRTLGKSTGWILRQELKDLKVRQIAGARYLKIDHDGLHIALGDRNEVLPADTIVVCAGQE